MRREIAAALQTILGGVTWDSPARGFAYTSQRLQVWDSCPAQPALYVTQGDERYTQITSREPKRDLEFRLVVYQNAGKSTSLPRPADENDMILDALEARLLATDTPDERQTLGGLCHHARIDGIVMKDSGDMDGQGMMVIPVWVMVP